MAWFFIEDNLNDGVCEYTLYGENALHASRSLRMRAGEELTLVSPDQTRYDCRVAAIGKAEVRVQIDKKSPCQNEPDVFVTLYQALPKGDKMDYIVQKCTELGVSRIVPMMTSRCVSRPNPDSLLKKCGRWQKIALQAAMQSRRGIVPKVCPCVDFKDAARLSRQNDKSIFFYELGGESVKKILSGSKPRTVGMFIGSEGGFAPDEAALAQESGAEPATLGRRILRAETAPLAALSIIMYQTDNF